MQKTSPTRSLLFALCGPFKQLPTGDLGKVRTCEVPHLRFWSTAVFSQDIRSVHPMKFLQDMSVNDFSTTRSTRSIILDRRSELADGRIGDSAPGRKRGEGRW